MIAATMYTRQLASNRDRDSGAAPVNVIVSGLRRGGALERNETTVRGYVQGLTVLSGANKKGREKESLARN